VAAGLELQVERDPLSERVEHLVERRHAPVAGGERAHIGERALADLAPAGQPGQALVVRDHDRPVARAVQVDLDHVGALVDGERVGGQRVLWPLAG
jgi:hypothetical protein